MAAAAVDPHAPPPLSLVDALVLALLFPSAQHRELAQDALGKALAAAPHVVGGHLLRLADYTAEPLWAAVASPLADLAHWLLLSGGGGGDFGHADGRCSSSSSSGGAGGGHSLLSPTPSVRAQGRALAARVLARLFQLHPALRDDLLGFLLTLAVPTGLLLLGGGGGHYPHHGHHDGGPGQRQHQQLAALLPVMRASRAVLAALATESPQLLLPYAGACGETESKGRNRPCIACIKSMTNAIDRPTCPIRIHKQHKSRSTQQASSATSCSTAPPPSSPPPCSPPCSTSSPASPARRPPPAPASA